MSRPLDENGVALPAAHLRLNMVPFQTKALFAMAEDSRAVALPVKRKLTLIDRAVDHVVDGGKVPAWVFTPDPEWPGNAFLPELWRTCVKAVEAVHRGRG